MVDMNWHVNQLGRKWKEKDISIIPGLWADGPRFISYYCISYR